MKKKLKILGLCFKDRGLLLRKMKLTLLILLWSIVSVNASIYSQVKISLELENSSVTQAIKEIEAESGYVFFYEDSKLDLNKRVDMSVKERDVKDVLDLLFENTSNDYRIIGNQVVITKRVILPETKEESVPAEQKTKKLTGNVKDSDGKPIPGVSVVVKGTMNGTITNENGEYDFNAPEDAKTLIFSFVGMKTVEQSIPANLAPIAVVMAVDVMTIEETIVTGYGTFKKSAYAGSASSLKLDAVKDVPAATFSQLLQGSTSGVQVSSTSNQPGGSYNIRIRGMGSFNASNSPLYVIDGVPMISGDISSQSYGTLDIMSTINPSDIESLTVIKDAAAASLYGSRAANGVILIKTRSGKKGKTTFSYKSDVGVSDFAMQYRPTMNGQERRDLLYEGMINKAMMVDGKTADAAKIYADGLIDTYAPIPWMGHFEDWNKLLLRKGRHQNHEFSVSGGTDKFTYYSSIGYTEQQGVSYQSEMERITGRLNVTYKATDKLELGANLQFSNVKQDVSDEAGTYTSPLYSTRNTVTPSEPAYNQDGTYATAFARNGTGRNPKAAADLCYNRQWITRAFNTLYAQYQITDALRFKSTFSYDYNILKANEWDDPRSSDGAKVLGEMNVEYNDRKKMVSSTVLSYEKSFAKNHNFDALVGYEIDDYQRDYLSGSASTFARATSHAIGNGSALFAVGGSDTGYRMLSYISRLNYNFKNTYFAGLSFRRDGSSRLSPDERWGNFWSVSGAWRVIAEPFMEQYSKVVSDLKLRTSYGINGTLPSDYFGFMSTSGFGNDYAGLPGFIETQIAYPELTWETNHNLNIGLDIALFNRVNMTFEYYNRTTKNLLMDLPLSYSTGFSSILTNIGQMENKGFEMEIQSQNIKGKDFSWTTNFNISKNNNKIKVLDGIQTEIISGSQIRKVGLPFYTYYMIEFAGINPDTGKPQFYTNTLDENGGYVKTITEDEKMAKPIPLGSADPKVTGGITNNLTYKWFDLGFTFTYSFGGRSYDSAAQKMEHGGYDKTANIPATYKDRWQKPGDVTHMEVFIFENPTRMHNITNSRRLHSTDHIRLKNLTFGVSLPKQWISKIGFTKTRIYAAASNLLTWAEYDQYDPEVPTGGSAYFDMPPLKTLTFGIDINF